MDVETRLNAFRRDRKRKETLDEVKKYISSPLNLLRKRMSATVASPEKGEETAVDCENEISETDAILEEEDDASSIVDGSTEDDNNLMGLHGITKYLAYFTLWFIPYILLIKIGFGAVYFCITALLFIYFNTRTRPKLKNEPSAYSVFNQGCAPIEGAVSSEQLEKQLRSGILG